MALHVAALYVTAGDGEGLARCRAALAEAAPGTNRDLSLVLMSALSCFHVGDLAGAGGKLASLSAADRVGIGGSNVERELVELIEAACVAGTA